MCNSFNRLLGAALLAAPLLLTSCAGVPLRERPGAELRRYEAYAGRPVKQIRWVNNYRRWSPIAAHKLLMWTNIEQPYLMTVFPPCTNLLFAHGIGITSTIDVTQARFDFVTADGWKCMIETIQPIDYRRMRQAERKAGGASQR
jgi:hypothetical protein